MSTAQQLAETETAQTPAEAGSISTAAPRNDRRDSAREPASDLSEISVDPNEVPLTCLIRNISEKGAMIETSLRNPAKRFILTNHVRHTRMVCEVVWRKGNLMGVRFMTSPRKLR